MKQVYTLRVFAIICLLLCLCSSEFALAQTLVIQGTVRDKTKNETLIGASLSVKGGSEGTSTDADGKFTLRTQAKLPLVLVVSYVGYDPLEVSVRSADKPLQIALTASKKILKNINIVGERLSQKQKESPLTVEAMDAIAIRETPAANFYEGLGQLKGVDLTSASIGFKVINTRGFNSTSPVRSLQLIDGVDNQAPGLNFSLGNFLGASELDVQKVDLIVGASSAFYGPNAFNGVVSMSTKSPFAQPGLSASVKTGERGLFETAVRYAKVWKTAEGQDRFGMKFNVFFMRANDWEATNMSATPQSAAPQGNPGGYDAVNRYGDERAFDFTDKFGKYYYPGLGVFTRKGYEEKDIVDYNTYNLKLNAAFHYKLKKGAEIIYSTNFGTGTTVYQGDNRYSLRDILFFQNRLEIRKEGKWFLRAYASNEDAGRSYDAVFTAVLLQKMAKNDVDLKDQTGSYYDDYFNYWSKNINPRYRNLPGYVPPTDPSYYTNIDRLNQLYGDSLQLWHQMAQAWANGGDRSPFGSNAKAQAYFQPGTSRFDSAFNAITSRTSFTEGGSRFWDRSALYHLVGERKFDSKFAQFTLGGNGRLYMPNSRGTIFSDTSGTSITNFEFGFYGGMEKRFWNDKLKGGLSMRMDKNQNFQFLFSPAASVVYTSPKGHILRFSFSSAIRNPTLQDQYLYYNLGTARLVGNLNGFDSLVTVPSLIKFLNNQNSSNLSILSYFNVDPIKPEKVQTFEIGYRATWWKSLFVDFSAYYSFYQDFIGYNLGTYFDYVRDFNLVTNIRVLRVAANAKDQVTTQGVSLGLNYFFRRYYTLNFNYSWNKLDRLGSNDPIIPAFNTPENKFNIGISGREIATRLFGINIVNTGFSINYKWVQGFRFEGSPQFTGDVPSYDMVDAQINYRHAAWKTTYKLGANNLLNNKAIQVYGGPAIGRLVYFSVLVDLGDKR